MAHRKQKKSGAGRKKKTRNPKMAPGQPGPNTSKSIISPWADFLCVGGLSIALMIGLLVYIYFRKSAGHGEVYFGSFIIIQALINWPHFMASYRLLYKPSSNIRKHPFATIYVPVLLVIVMGMAVVLGGAPAQGKGGLYIQQDIAYFMWLIAAFYLAWHYTGQAWGMIASFGYLAGISFTDWERLTLRAGLRVLLLWHVIWGAQDLPQQWLGPVYPYIPDLLDLVSAFAIAAFVIGAMTFAGIKRRTGIKPTPQMLAPWVAVYLWYLVLFFEPNAYLFVQFSHALQYLIFPLRVEINRNESLTAIGPGLKQILWSGRYYSLLVLLGLLVFYSPEILIEKSPQVYSFALLIASGVSIHHYFVDSRIWKISNKEVRNSLFSHIRRNAPQPPG